METKLVKKKILGIEITDASESNVLEHVFNFLAESKEKMYIVTPNPEIMVYANRHDSFTSVLNQAGIAVCDGVGLLWASRVLGRPVKERISGVDFMEKLCKESVREGVSVGFMGGRGNVAEKTAECLREKYPGLKVAFVSKDWNEAGFRNGSKAVDLLFVAFGFPKQEQWMAENIERLPVRVMMGVGGAFDYISGEVQRAPKFVRSVGLEWLYRLIRQPWRLKRQMALPAFVVLVLKERLSVKKH